MANDKVLLTDADPRYLPAGMLHLVCRYFQASCGPADLPEVYTNLGDTYPLAWASTLLGCIAIFV